MNLSWTSGRKGPDGSSPTAAGTAALLLVLSWLARVAVFVAVGFDTFRFRFDSPGTVALAVSAYTLSGLMLLAWGLTSAYGGPAAEHPLRLPLVFGVLTVAAGLGSALPHSGDLIALALIGALGAASEASPIAGWAVTGAGILAVEIGALATGAGTGATVGYPLLLLFGLLVGHNRRAYRIQAEQSDALLNQVEQLRTEQRRVAVLDERTRIAREIHDILAHSLGALGIQIQVARALLSDQQDIDRALDVLGSAQQMVSAGLTDTRSAVHALRTDIPSLEEALAAAAQAHRSSHHATVNLIHDGAPAVLPADRTVTLLRIAQESLTNAAKHAPDQPVDLTLQDQDDHVTLSVSNPLGHRADDDTRFATVDGGYGLTGMRERLLLLGGTLTAGVQDGRWVVTARVPR